MPDISTIQLPLPSSWDEFEDICADLFAEIWGDIHTNRYERTGQRQNGVDIYGRRKNLRCGVQCKEKQNWPPKNLTVAEINSEVAKALKFEPALDEFIFATTAPSDVTAIDRANEITKEHEKNGLFSVHVWSWNKILRELKSHPDLFSKYYGSIINVGDRSDLRRAVAQLEEKAKSDALPAEYADIEIQKFLKPIIRYRYLPGFEFKEKLADFLDELQNGNLRNGSANIKSNAFGWCASLLAKTDLSLATKALAEARKNGDDDIPTIAKAFVLAEQDRLKEALGLLNDLATPAARSAALTLINTASDDVDDHDAALDWIEKSQLTFMDFDSHGQILILLWWTNSAKLKDVLAEANSLTEESFETAPFLRLVYAMANLKSIIPQELPQQLARVPLELRDFPLLMTDDALDRLQLAKRHFERFSQQTIDDGVPQFGIAAEEFALWLKIRDPNSIEQGIEDLKRCLAKTEDWLRYIKFAIEFGIPNLDFSEISKEVDRQLTLSGRSSADAAITRLYLVNRQKSPSDKADYIERHREDFIDYVSPIWLAQFEIKILVSAGRITLAQSLLDKIGPDEISENTRLNLNRVIEEGQGGNAIALRIAEFEKTDTLPSLMDLLNELEEKDDQTLIVKYAEILFVRVPNEVNLCRLVNGLHQTGELQAALDLIDQNDNFVSRTLYLKKMKALLLYELGHVVDAQKEISALASEVDDPHIHDIQIRIAIVSGDWERLNTFVEQDWLNRDKLSVQQLMQAANQAKRMGSTRLPQFLVEATSRDNPSAELMINAYHLAVSANLEEETQEHGWLARAIELSGNDGPVRSVPLSEIKDINPDREERQKANLDAVKRAERPIYIAAHMNNISLCEQMLIPALGNLDEGDPRRRALIYTQTGVSRSVSDPLKCIMLEPTALITVMLLDIYDDLLQCFDMIYLPHATLAWLLEERQRIQFHQPSQIENARKTHDLLQISGIEQFRPNRALNNDLAFDIGRSLSDMIVEASTTEESNADKKYVVRSAPVYRITNLFSEEEIDISEYSSVLVSCSRLVEALHEEGRITEEEAEIALSILSNHEKSWPNEPAIEPKAKLFVDSLSVTYLLPLGILEKAAQAGYRIFIEDEKSNLVNQLLRYSNVSERAANLIEKLRTRLAEDIRESRILLAPISPVRHGGIEIAQLSQHPSIGIMEAPPIVDAIISDDRYFNKSANISLRDQRVPILTTADLLKALVAQEALTSDIVWAHRIRMRQANFMLMDLESEELLNFIGKARVQNGSLIETAELRAIRENWHSAKMFKAAVLPNDAPWLHQTLKIIESVLKAQWNDGIPDDEARAKSDWLLALREMTVWSSAFDTDTFVQLLEFMRELQITSLLMPAPDISDEARARYWEWVETAILDDLRLNEPVTFNKIVKMVSDDLINSADRIPSDTNMTLTQEETERGVIVDLLVHLYPSSVRGALLRNETLIDRFGIQVDQWVTFSGTDISVLKSQLHEIAITLFADPESNPTIEDRNSTKCTATLDVENEGFIILVTNEHIIPIPYLWMLMPEKADRIAELEKASNTYGLSLSKLAKWKEILGKRCANGDEVDLLVQDINNTIAAVEDNIEEEFRKNSCVVREFVPIHTDYYENLVGKITPGNTASEFLQDDYIKFLDDRSHLPPARQISNALLSCWHSMSAKAISEIGCDFDELVRLIENTAEKDSACAVAGLAEVCLYKLEKEPRLIDHVDKLIKRLLSDGVEEHSLKLLSSICIFVDAELATSKSFEFAPPYYRRLAAFSHACALERVFRELALDSPDYAELCDDMTDAFILQNLCDMREEPHWLPAHISPQPLWREFLSRLVIAAGQIGDFLPEGVLKSKLLEDVEGGLLKHLTSIDSLAPGPLEGDGDSVQPILPEIEQMAIAQLKKEVIDADSFIATANIATGFKPNIELADLAATKLEDARFYLRGFENEEALWSFVGGMALLAAKTRCQRLAGSLRRFVSQMPSFKSMSIDTQQIVRSGLIAAAAFETVSGWSDFLGEWFGPIAFGELSKSEALEMYASLKIIVSYVPVSNATLAPSLTALEIFQKS